MKASPADVGAEMREIIHLLEELRDDREVNRHCRERVSRVMALLSANSGISNEKALLELEELNSLGLSSYHRTMVWDLIGRLESVKKQT